MALDCSIPLSTNPKLDSLNKLNPLLLLLNTDGLLFIYQIISTRRTEKYSGLREIQKLPTTYSSSQQAQQQSLLSESKVPLKPFQPSTETIPMTLPSISTSTFLPPLSTAATSQPFSFSKLEPAKTFDFSFNMSEKNDTSQFKPFTPSIPSEDQKSKSNFSQLEPKFSFKNDMTQSTSSKDVLQSNFSFGISSMPNATDKSKFSFSNNDNSSIIRSDISSKPLQPLIEDTSTSLSSSTKPTQHEAYKPSFTFAPFSTKQAMESTLSKPAISLDFSEKDRASDRMKNEASLALPKLMTNEPLQESLILKTMTIDSTSIPAKSISSGKVLKM
jgi:hypothetical protein